MCEKAVEKDPWSLEYVTDHFKTQKTCEKAVDKHPSNLSHVPNDPKFREMREKQLRNTHGHWSMFILI